ncbi:hypothetical protein [Microbacterium testaceum]|uniref:hypothetical protein n=1 Tax=Microbacterium testaceum TaxID=2033 RepID=UPI00128EB596|nr:hypothetical protein [Microbacterium testaceum]
MLTGPDAAEPGIASGAAGALGAHGGRIAVRDRGGRCRTATHKRCSRAETRAQRVSARGSRLCATRAALGDELHEGDTFVRMLAPDEVAAYPSMTVLGFELVESLLGDESRA